MKQYEYEFKIKLTFGHPIDKETCLHDLRALTDIGFNRKLPVFSLLKKIEIFE